MRKILFFLMVFTLLPMASWSQKKGEAYCRVVPVVMDNDAANNGLIYSLPKTVIRVKVDAEIVVRKAGPFYRYSQKYFNITDVVKEDETVWQINSVSLQSVGMPDESRMYKIDTDGNGAAPLLSLTPQGIIAGVNLCKSVNDNALISNVMAFSRPVAGFDDVPLCEEVLTKTSLAAMAEEAAFAVYRLRKKRTDLLAGEGAKNFAEGSAIEVSLKEIERLETVYMSMFVGDVKKTIVTRYFDYIADEASTFNNVLFRFSAQNGFLDRMNVSGTPVYIDVARIDTKKVSELPAGAKRSQEVNGLRYILPGKAVVKITDRNIPLMEQEMMIAQFGQVATLPVSMLRQNDITIELCTSTGALVRVSRAVN